MSSSTQLAALVNATAPKNTAMLAMLAALRSTKSPSVPKLAAAGARKVAARFFESSNDAIAAGHVELQLGAYARDLGLFSSTSLAALLNATPVVNTAKWAGLVGQTSSTMWASIAEQLDVGSWTPPTLARTWRPDLRPVPAAPEPVELAPVPTPPETLPEVQRRLRPLVVWTIVVLVFYIDLDVVTRIILGADAWHEVQGEVSTFLAIVALIVALDQNNRRR
jgi:hypothetical protein